MVSTETSNAAPQLRGSHSPPAAAEQQPASPSPDRREGPFAPKWIKQLLPSRLGERCPGTTPSLGSAKSAPSSLCAKLFSAMEEAGHHSKLSNMLAQPNSTAIGQIVSIAVEALLTNSRLGRQRFGDLPVFHLHTRHATAFCWFGSTANPDSPQTG